MSGTVDVVVRRAFAAPPERVFDAFLDVGVARHFLFATTHGQSIEAMVDPRVGGGYVFTERRAEMGDVRHSGEYLEIERPKRLVFTFGVPRFGDGFTVVSIEIAREGLGCALTLTNAGASAAYADRVREGWARVLDGLLPAYEGRHAAGWT